MIERHDGGGPVIALQECVVKEVVARTAKPSVAKSDRQTASQSGRQGWMDGWMEGGMEGVQTSGGTGTECDAQKMLGVDGQLAAEAL
jgi:hypothetical protein